MLRHDFMPNQPHLILRLAAFGRRVADFCQQLFHPRELFSSRETRDQQANLNAHQDRPAPRDSGQRSAPLLIHYHIFKNAGSSFEWALQEAFGHDYRSFDSPTPRGFISGDDLAEFALRHPSVRAIASHQAAPPSPAIPEREVVTSILIRDPIARIRSIYAFERSQQAGTPGALKAKELSFRGYVEWRLQTAPDMLCNFQVHFCTRTAEKQTGAPNRERLEKAISNLDATSIVGTVARYDEWIALAERILASSFPGLSLPSVRRNATARTALPEVAILEQLVSELGEDTAQFLIKNNELDMCLHQVADALLTRRLAERGVRISLLQAYTDAQQAQVNWSQVVNAP
ncbi:MAG: hypothetical protein ABIR38_03250 [Chthoniobacterales bacterium]